MWYKKVFLIGGIFFRCRLFPAFLILLLDFQRSSITRGLLWSRFVVVRSAVMLWSVSRLDDGGPTWTVLWVTDPEGGGWPWIQETCRDGVEAELVGGPGGSLSKVSHRRNEAKKTSHLIMIVSTLFRVFFGNYLISSLPSFKLLETFFPSVAFSNRQPT